MLSLTNACRKGKYLLFAMPFLAQYSYSLASPPLPPAAPDTICPSGNVRERSCIEEALSILSITNAEMYTDIMEAKDVFVIRLGEFSDSAGTASDFRLRQRTTVFFDQPYLQIEQQGAFGVYLVEHNAIKAAYSVNTGGFVFTRGGRNSEEGKRVNISEEEADSLIRLKDPLIIIQANLCKKNLARVLAHEFGHADYILRHRARAEFFPADPSLLAHDRGNPDGDAADAAERQFDREYKRALQTLHNVNAAVATNTTSRNIAANSRAGAASRAARTSP
jgi:hypothetical protein